MKWQNLRRSSNVEDRRGLGRPAVFAGGGVTVIGIIIYLLLGRDPGALLESLQNGDPGVAETVQTDPHEDVLAAMSSSVLASTEDVWSGIFTQSGLTYTNPKLVLFTGGVESACGFAQTASGPFYCSGDRKVYLDLGFFDELVSRFGASGDFAQAYVIAHEVGHHVQNLLGTLDKVHQKMESSGEREANKLSVRLELQADFYAGIWAHFAEQATAILEKGDLEEALNAASQIGDDRMQKKSQGYVVPDAFTHGSSAQRLKWFKKGFDSGDPAMASLLFEQGNI
ncbi:MAG: neutral zinc metallopeptidase [Bacteroidales bacterium]